jgi:hypothetical protein
MEQKPSPRDFDPVYYDMDSFVDNKASPVFHGFFGRQGGESKGVYAGLNCALGSQDNPEAIFVNRRVIAEIAGCDPEAITTVYQVHSNICVYTDKPFAPDERPKADALVTDVPGLALGILTADCAPVLFYAKKPDGRPLIGAAHAGWSGALNGVLESTVRELEKLGADVHTIKACIGPCIGPVSYEVTEDFAEAFIEENPENERFFRAARRTGHLMFDLAGYCAFKLAELGLKEVLIKDLDTYFNEEDFFSYRRAVHRKEEDYGRQISLIMIKGEGQAP